MAALLDSKSSEEADARIQDVVQKNISEGRRGKIIDDFESFIPSILDVLLSKFPVRADAYTSCLLSMCESSEPRVKADAALILAHVVVSVPSEVRARINSLGIVNKIAGLCKHEHQIVRSRAVQSLARFGDLS